MRIRKFRKEDARKVSFLIRRCLREVNSKDYPKSTIRFLESHNSSNKLVENSKEKQMYVAAEGDNILGTASLKDDLILTVYVNPKFHGRGIGRKLMEKVESLAKKKGFKSVILPSSLTAVDFYRKVGYRKIKEKVEDNIGKVIIMKKPL